ncbi:Gfo/Idh/MocA family protein [Epibacterium ulvae]|uniref:Gfo/Idh/MocA family protein n=1 Tax=Epibacterium ulvae TaxID=1156985 RepID=UPI00248FF5AC|nr:Gfo/Idh/MocA family oxidoreductase [Epibacterium ulvae]
MRRLKLGMVGGGEGAFIGEVHRIAARLDGHFDLVAGAFSSDAERAHRSARDLGVEAARSYADFREMAKAEAARADGLDAVSIVTPNHLHGEIAMAFLEAGIAVICDKPMTATLEQAEALTAVAKRTKTPFFLTHNYTGYPMVRQARDMIAQGALGALRLIDVAYLQDWLTRPTDPAHKQASWRINPDLSGGGAIGDIGSHAYNLLRFVTGLRPETVSAQLRSFVPGRAVDDDVRATLTFAGETYGQLWASQVAVGNENNLSLKIYGEAAALEWHQERPDQLIYTEFGAPRQILTRGGAGANAAARAVTRVPNGHPEGYLEAFATLYAEAASVLRGEACETVVGIEDGLEGMRFIDACQTSSRQGGGAVTFAASG